jgi:hypothetical protein
MDKKFKSVLLNDESTRGDQSLSGHTEVYNEYYWRVKDAEYILCCPQYRHQGYQAL